MGYDYTPAALHRMTNTLRDSAQRLSQTTSGAPPAPDAGDSSALLAKVINDLLRSGAAIAAKQESIADKIHANKGSYDHVENTNASRFRDGTTFNDNRHISHFGNH